MATHTQTERERERERGIDVGRGFVSGLSEYYTVIMFELHTRILQGQLAMPCCGPCPVAAPLLILPIKHKVIMSSRLRKWVKITITM